MPPDGQKEPNLAPDMSRECVGRNQVSALLFLFVKKEKRWLENVKVLLVPKHDPY